MQLFREMRYISSFNIFYSSSLNTKRIICMQSDDLLLEPYLDPNISETEPHRALKINIIKEQFIKNQNLKAY